MSSPSDKKFSANPAVTTTSPPAISDRPTRASYLFAPAVGLVSFALSTSASAAAPPQKNVTTPTEFSRPLADVSPSGLVLIEDEITDVPINPLVAWRDADGTLHLRAPGLLQLADGDCGGTYCATSSCSTSTPSRPTSSCASCATTSRPRPTPSCAAAVGAIMDAILGGSDSDNGLGQIEADQAALRAAQQELERAQAAKARAVAEQQRQAQQEQLRKEAEKRQRDNEEQRRWEDQVRQMNQNGRQGNAAADPANPFAGGESPGQGDANPFAAGNDKSAKNNTSAPDGENPFAQPAAGPKDPSVNYGGEPCAYFTKPADAAHTNMYAEDSHVCYGDKMYACEGKRWRYRGKCNSFQGWQKRRAEDLEVSKFNTKIYESD